MPEIQTIIALCGLCLSAILGTVYGFYLNRKYGKTIVLDSVNKSNNNKKHTTE